MIVDDLGDLSQDEGVCLCTEFWELPCVFLFWHLMLYCCFIATDRLKKNRLIVGGKFQAKRRLEAGDPSKASSKAMSPTGVVKGEQAVEEVKAPSSSVTKTEKSVVVAKSVDALPIESPVLQSPLSEREALAAASEARKGMVVEVNPLDLLKVQMRVLLLFLSFVFSCS